jgi:integrase
MHKTEHKEKCRVICLGPRAQAVLGPLIEDGGKDVVFSPAAVAAERSSAKRASRKTRVQPSQMNRRKADPEKEPGECYSTLTYGRAISYAVQAARRSGLQVSAWSPNQLRHACGTRVRRKFGPDSARAVLGHTGQGGVRVTDIYTREAIEREMIMAASRPMKVIG